YQVSANGSTGWVMAQYLSQADAPAKSPDTSAKSAAPAKPSAPAAAAARPKLVGLGRVANTDGDPLRIRSSASRSATIVTILDPDASVAIKQGPFTDQDNVLWYQVSAKGVTGWAMGQYLAQAQVPAAPAAADKPAAPAAVKPAAAPAPAAQKPAAPAVVAQPAVTVSAPAAPVTRSAPVPAPPVERTGSSRGVQPPTASSSHGDSIVSLALRYVGYRYRYGGTSPSGFDCSGFVYYVLNKAGVPMSRDMYAQLNSGPRVSSSNLQPGDLVFFSGTYKRGLSHAGIYIGNGKFVHAENAGTGVRVSALWSSYWAAHYTAAVRPR
ncbi:MAG: C40 family peptidase, partial [Chloroflexota bacterium]|nr:C40 family peptidase [Chloroflexota bacterium]